MLLQVLLSWLTCLISWLLSCLLLLTGLLLSSLLSSLLFSLSTWLWWCSWSCLMRYILFLSTNFSFYVSIFSFLCSWILLNCSIKCLIYSCGTINTIVSSFSISVNCWKSSSVCTTKVYIRKPDFSSTCELSQLYSWRDPRWLAILLWELLCYKWYIKLILGYPKYVWFSLHLSTDQTTTRGRCLCIIFINNMYLTVMNVKLKLNYLYICADSHSVFNPNTYMKVLLKQKIKLLSVSLKDFFRSEGKCWCLCLHPSEVPDSASDVQIL